MRILTIVSLMVLVLSQDSLAQELEVQLRSCVQIQARNERIDCYDKLSGRPPQDEVKQEVSGGSLAGGEWQLIREASPIDDSEIVYLVLAASEAAQIALSRNHPQPFIRCKEKRLAGPGRVAAGRRRILGSGDA